MPSSYISSGLSAIPYYGIPSVQAYFIKINNVQVFSIAGSLKIDLSVGRRSQATFQVHTDTNTHFQQYQQVKIYDHNGVLIFSGYIMNPKEQKMGFHNSLIHTITCADNHFLADKRIIAKVYTNMTVGAIVQDILTNYLAAEGVTLGTAGSSSAGSATTTSIFDGLLPSATLYPSTTLYPNGNVGVVSNTTFSYCTVAAALDSLVTEASSAGVQYYWAIDQNKRLFFQPYTAAPSGTIIDGSWIDQKTNGATVQRQNAKYRNKQWLTGGLGQTSQMTETRTSDGTTTSWTMGYPLFSAPAVTVNGTGQTVGLKGAKLAAGATPPAWLWAPGDPVIVQDTSNGQSVIVASQTLKFTYIGQYPSIVVAQDQAQIAAQASLDGSSGIIEAVIDDPTLTDVPSAITEASRFLGQYAVPGILLTFTTLVSGWVPGQLVTVNLPWHGLSNAQMLIESVSIADSDGYNIWHTVSAVIGPYDNTWVQFYSQLLVKQQPAASINVGAQITTTNVQITTTAIRDAAMRFGLTSGPQPPTSKLRDAVMRFRLQTSGVITSVSQTITASITAPSANLSASTATTGGGGGTGGQVKLKLFKFGDDCNSSSLSTTSYVAGTNILAYWADISSTADKYDFTTLEGWINPWASNNKTCIIRVSVAGHASWRPNVSKQGTPQWVFDAGVTKITSGTDQSIKPQYWNSTFQTKMKAMIQALATKYDGDPRIQAFQIAVGDGGESKTDSSKDPNKLTNMTSNGYTDQKWIDYIHFVIDTYAAAFKKTQLIIQTDTDMLQHTVSSPEVAVTADYVVQNYGSKIWIQKDNFTANSQSLLSGLVTDIAKTKFVQEQKEPITGYSQDSCHSVQSANGDSDMKSELDIVSGAVASSPNRTATSGIFLIFDKDLGNSSYASDFNKYI